MKQLNLIPLETFPLRVKYDVLFEPLPSLSLNPKERGRPPFSRDALLKAFIYKALRRLKTLSDLAFEFLNNPMMSQAVGFNPYQDPPTVERFSKFLRETPHPADVSEVHPAIPMLKKTKETFSLLIETVSGDALYDSEKILRLIIEDLNAQAIIPRNSRSKQCSSYSRKGDDLYCQANLPLYRKGKMTIKRSGITYLQYCCPIHFGKERQNYLLCPVSHPKFTNQKGCNVLIRLTPSIRERIDYGSATFKELHKKRSSVERVFSRLLSIAMQEPPVVGIKSIRNYCTIAHITVLLVALAAKRSGHLDKIRFVRSFVPNFLT